MDKLHYLISVFERLSDKSPAIAERGKLLKEGKMTGGEIDALYVLVSEIMESAAAKMTGKRASALAAMLTGLREKEREESGKDKAEDVLETFF